MGFKILSRDDISGSGRIVLKKLDALRTRVANDPNLVIADGADTTTALELVVEYITTLNDILKTFQETPDDIEETNIAGQAAIDEMVDLESELLSIKTYCKVNAAVPLRAEDIIAVQKLKAQEFPSFDGTDDGTTFLTPSLNTRRFGV